MNKRLHGNALRTGRFSAEGTVYFITSNVENRRPLLDPATREIVIEALLWARTQGRIWLLGYAIMDDHFHVLLALRGDSTLASVMDGLKRRDKPTDSAARLANSGRRATMIMPIGMRGIFGGMCNSG